MRGDTDRSTRHASTMLDRMAAAPIRVLVVEDDVAMAAGIVRGLKGAGFDVEVANDGVAGARAALAGAHDVVVLDLMLPEQSGFAVLEQIQSRCMAQVIVLTARTQLDDRLQSFALGAADFIAKPFFIEELVARIRTRLRTADEAPKRVFRWADVTMDFDARVVATSAGEASLTRHEFEILAYLVERPGRAVSRRQLAERAAIPFEDRDARTVDTHIARVRKKLGAAAAAAIVTVWGIGYRFDPNESAAT
jgi:two-component system, OmpR family, response regulator